MKLFTLFNMLFDTRFQMTQKIKEGQTYKVKKCIFSVRPPQYIIKSSVLKKIHCKIKYSDHQKRAQIR